MSFTPLPRAEEELRDILRARAEQAGLAAALRLDDGFQRLFDLIGATGAPGAIRRDFAPEAYRFALNNPYWVIWRQGSSADERVIVKIIDARRDIARFLSGLSY